MGSRADRFFGRLSTHATLWDYGTRAARWTGILGVGGVTGYITYVIEKMAVWSPLSWWLAVLVGSLVAAWVYAGIGWGRKHWLVSRAYAGVGKTMTINPLENTFCKKKIKLSDFEPVAGLAHEDKTFTECELHGPANILFIGNTLVLRETGS